jgi:hypothetical protein
MIDNANNTKTSVTGTHYLKSHPRYFEGACNGSRHFEVRLDDRGFRVGDKIVLHEWDPEMGKKREADGYTGNKIEGFVTCITRAADLTSVGEDIIRDGYVVLGIRWSHLT